MQFCRNLAPDRPLHLILDVSSRSNLSVCLFLKEKLGGLAHSAPQCQVEPSPHAFKTHGPCCPSAPILRLGGEVLREHLVCVRPRRNVSERDLKAVRCCVDRRGSVSGGDRCRRCGCETAQGRENHDGYHLFTSPEKGSSRQLIQHFSTGCSTVFPISWKSWNSPP